MDKKIYDQQMKELYDEVIKQEKQTRKDITNLSAMNLFQFIVIVLLVVMK